MRIHKKTLNGNSDSITTVGALFSYAKEVLGDSWSYNPSEDGTRLVLWKHGSNTKLYGWDYGTTNTKMVSDSTQVTGATIKSERTSLFSFTGVVFEMDSGSVAIGIINSSGKYEIWFLLIQFNGTYMDHEVYGVTMLAEATPAPIWTTATTNVGDCNHCSDGARSIGSGIYLHPVYDPVSGLTCSDIFGVQSMDIESNAKIGTVIKQGGTSYLAALDGAATGANLPSALFIKM